MSDKKAPGSLTDVTGSTTDSTEKVERIREIIFGAQIRDYAQKFDVLQRENTRLNREIERLNELLREQEKSLNSFRLFLREKWKIQKNSVVTGMIEQIQRFSKFIWLWRIPAFFENMTQIDQGKGDVVSA